MYEMNKAMIKTRIKMMENRMKDPEYQKTSYEKQKERKTSDFYYDDRARIEWLGMGEIF